MKKLTKKQSIVRETKTAKQKKVTVDSQKFKKKSHREYQIGNTIHGRRKKISRKDRKTVDDVEKDQHTP